MKLTVVTVKYFCKVLLSAEAGIKTTVRWTRKICQKLQNSKVKKYYQEEDQKFNWD